MPETHTASRAAEIVVGDIMSTVLCAVTAVLEDVLMVAGTHAIGTPMGNAYSDVLARIEQHVGAREG